MKKAILIVSFGTRHPETLRKTIGAIEEYSSSYFPDHKVYRAFTSEMIREMLLRKEGIKVDSVSEALYHIKSEGTDCVIVQPTYVVHGAAYLKLRDEIAQYRNFFRSLRLGAPLLNSTEDYKACVHAMISEWKLKKEEIIVIAGHGTMRYAQSAYTMLEYMFHTLGYTNVIVGTVQGFPDINNVMEKLALLQKNRIRLIPFMIVSGEHVQSDLTKGEKAWAERFERMGFPTEVVNRGLGEMKGIQRIFAEHMKEAMES